VSNKIRFLAGYISMAISLVTCPCHLLLVLLVLVSLIPGTVLAGWLTEHLGQVILLSTFLFISTFALGYILLRDDIQPRPHTAQPAPKAKRSGEEHCERCESPSHSIIATHR
jgi:uncharacterized membrane protein YfcA